MQLLACARRFPTPADGRPVDHAQQHSDREARSGSRATGRAVAMPSDPSHLATLTAFPAPNEHGAAVAVKVALLESERFADPQPCLMTTAGQSRATDPIHRRLASGCSGRKSTE